MSDFEQKLEAFENRLDELTDAGKEREARIMMQMYVTLSLRYEQITPYQYRYFKTHPEYKQRLKDCIASHPNRHVTDDDLSWVTDALNSAFDRELEVISH